MVFGLWILIWILFLQSRFAQRVAFWSPVDRDNELEVSDDGNDFIAVKSSATVKPKKEVMLKKTPTSSLRTIFYLYILFLQEPFFNNDSSWSVSSVEVNVDLKESLRNEKFPKVDIILSSLCHACHIYIKLYDSTSLVLQCFQL